MSTSRFLNWIGTAVLISILGLQLGCAPDPDPDTTFSGLPKDVEADFEKALRLSDALDRAESLVKILKQTRPEHAESLHAVLVGSPDLVPDPLSEALLAAWWARFDPKAAFASRVNPSWAHRHPWLREVLPYWLREDPIAALKAVRSLPATPAHGKTEAIQVLVDEWFATEAGDPTPLLLMVSGLELQPRSFATERLLVRMVEAKGHEETANWVLTLRRDADELGSQIRNEMMGRMGVVLAKEDMALGVQWAEEHGRGPDGHGVLIHFAFHYGMHDGPGAMKWAMSLKDISNPRGVVRRAWVSFSRTNRARAREWIFSQKPDGRLAPILPNQLQGLATEDPARALEIAMQAPPGEFRNRLLIAVGRGWLSFDQAAARAWLEGPEIPPKVASVLKKKGRATAVDGDAPSGPLTESEPPDATDA
ncbi:MAG: hypothetical protein CL933_04935 [Deltaproteobacteria bacterium]|nr:hypothetical protein [Deltaproteobacteria bacterium]